VAVEHLQVAVLLVLLRLAAQAVAVLTGQQQVAQEQSIKATEVETVLAALLLVLVEVALMRKELMLFLVILEQQAVVV